MSKVHLRRYLATNRCPLPKGVTGVWQMPSPSNEAASWNVYHLRRASDGDIVVHVDDGMGFEGSPLNGRQRLMTALEEELAPGVPHVFTDDPLEPGPAKVGLLRVTSLRRPDGKGGTYEDPAIAAFMADSKAARADERERAEFQADVQRQKIDEAKSARDNSADVVKALLPNRRAKKADANV